MDDLEHRLDQIHARGHLLQTNLYSLQAENSTLKDTIHKTQIQTKDIQALAEHDDQPGCNCAACKLHDAQAEKQWELVVVAEGIRLHEQEFYEIQNTLELVCQAPSDILEE